MSEKSNSRRDFMKMLALTAAALPLSAVLSKIPKAIAKVKEVALPAGVTEVPATDAVAMALGYKGNVKDIDYTKYPKRKEAAAKNQFCDNCAQYTKFNDGWGKCTMVAAGAVAAKGWCGSWSKKA